MSSNSHVKVIPSEDKAPQANLYIIDQQLPDIFGVPAHEIKVIDNFSLLNFSPNNHNSTKSSFIFPHDFFLPELYYSSTSNLLTGSWVDQKLSNVEDLTIILPFKSFIQEYFSSEYLEKNVVIRPVIIDQSPGINISLKIHLTGIDQTVAYHINQNFPLKKENELSDDFPSVALWPNLSLKSSWQEFFVFVSVLDNEGEEYAFQINVPITDAEETICAFGQEKYYYWKCKYRPDILEVTNYNSELLVIIPLISIDPEPNKSDYWTIGVDLNPSFTNIYLCEKNKAPKRFQLTSDLLKVTLGLEVRYPEFHDYIYRNYFILDTLVPEGNLPPMSTALITRGWQEQRNAIAKIITEARIYNPRSDGEFSDYAKTNIKWEKIEYIESFLSQLVRMIAVQSILKGVKLIDWNVSYPSSFSLMQRNLCQDLWERILDELSSISGQSHSLKKLISEHTAFASYFIQAENELIIHATCVSIQESASVLSFWQDNRLIHKVEILYAERDLFHNLLRHNLDYFDEIFGLSQDDVKRLRIGLAEDPINFNLIFDLRLRMEDGNNAGENTERPSLFNGYRMNKQRKCNRQFRTLLAFAYCGLFHYIGLIQKYLKQEEIIPEDYLTSLLVGGQGSRFIHWLSPTEPLEASSEIIKLIEGIMISASGLNRNPHLLTLSQYPQHEIAAGLAGYSDSDRLKDMPIKTIDNLFLGEACVINDKEFAPHNRLTLDYDWNEIKEFSLTSTAELEKYLQNFNQVIKERNIEEIEQLRDFKSGELLQLNDDFRKLLAANLRKQCLRKQGPKNQFEPDPPFLMVLKSFLEVLSKQWSRARAD